MTRTIALVLAATSVCVSTAFGAYNDSKYLLFQNNVGTYVGSDSSTYPTTGMAGWGTSPPAIGATLLWPSAYGGGVQRRADHSQLTGDYNGTSPPESLIVYSRYTPVNTTGDMVLVHGDNSTSCWVFNTKTNLPFNGVGGPPLRMKPSLGNGSRALGEVNELRWDYTGTHPYRLYFVGRSISNSNAVGAENVPTSFYFVDIDSTTGAQSIPTPIHDFSTEFPAAGTYPVGGYAGATIMNDVEGDSSYDSRYWAWQVMNDALGTGSQPYAFITYDMTTNAIIGRLQRDCGGIPSPCRTISTPGVTAPYITRPNMIEISPLATKVLVDFNRIYLGSGLNADIGGVDDAPHVFELDFSTPFVVGSDATHSGWAWGPNGEEMFVSQNNRNDFLEAVDIRSATTAKCSPNFDGTAYNYSCGTKIAYYQSFDPTYDGVSLHFGRIYDRSKRGWAYVDISDSIDGWGKNKIVFIELKDVTAASKAALPRIWRVAPAPNTYVGGDYRSEGSAALNFSATEIWTSGNWGQSAASKAEVYSMGVPSDWDVVLNGPPSTSPPKKPAGLKMR